MKPEAGIKDMILSYKLMRSTLAVILLIAASTMGVSTTAAADGPQAGRITDLGEPVQKYQSLGTAIGPGPDGRPLAFFTVQGNSTTNTEFAVVDIRSKKTIFDARLPQGNASGRSMDYSSADSSVYFGTGDTGVVYRYKPGSDKVELLGVPIEGQRIWDVYAAPDGTIWGGTYPGGQLWSYDPGTGKFHNYGQAIEGQQYIQSIVQAGDAIYVGTGNQPNTPKLARFDPQTGEFTPVALPDGHDEESGTIKGLHAGDGKLMAVFNGKLFVYDLSTGSWVDQIDDLSGLGVSPVDPSTGNTVYFRISSGCLARYNLDTLSYTQVNGCPNAFPESFAWIDMNDPTFPGLSLAFTYYRHARIYVFNFGSGESYFHQSDVMGAGAPLTTIGTGPNGNIYAGAYLSPPGMGRWNPDKGKWELLSGSGQVEGYGTFNGDLVFGRYPQGTLYRYDVDKPWDNGTNPKPPIAIGHEQNRPTAFVDIGDRVAVGSVPEPGFLGGAITLWDPNTDDLQVFRNVVPEQTPVSLVYHDGLIYGGTSIYGGYGIDPTTSEGKLFIWDPVTHETVFRTVPVPGATNVAGLVVDDRGRIWGLAGSTIFEFDPKTRKVRRTKQLFEHTDGARYGDEHDLRFVDDRLFGVTGNRLFYFDTRTWKVVILDSGQQLGNLVVDRYGDLYYTYDSSHVYRYDLPENMAGPGRGSPLSPVAAIDVTSSETKAEPGQQVTVAATLTNEGNSALANVSLALRAPTGWDVRPSTPTIFDSVLSGNTVSASWTATAPDVVIREQALTIDANYLYRGQAQSAQDSVVLAPGGLIPQSQMSATATSYHTGYEPDKALDGDPTTMWHSQFNPDLPLPQSITLDLGGAYNVGILTYLPRQSGGNGIITHYNIYVSSDGEDFIKMATGDWPYNHKLKEAAFPAHEARYVRLEAVDGVNGFASAAEINIGYEPGK